MIAGLREIVSALFDQFSFIWVVYTTLPVVSSFFALWVLDRVFHIFDILKR